MSQVVFNEIISYYQQPYHMICTIFGLIVNVQAFLTCHLVTQNLECLVDDFECLLRAIDIVWILIGMHQHGEAAILLFDLFGCCVRLQLHYLERIQIEIGRSGTQQAGDLLFVGENRVALLDLFHLG